MYAELHCHSSFSFLDGASSPEDLAGRAKELGLRALALTDRDGLYGAVRFHQAARAAGLQSILGAEVTLDTGHHLTLLVRNEWGYRNLSTLLTLGRTRRPKGESAVTFAEVEKYADGLIVLSGCPAHGLVAAPLATGDAEGARRAAGRLREAFGPENVFIEVQHHLVSSEARTAALLLDLARAESIPAVATNDVRYHRPAGRRLHDVLAAIRHGLPLDAMGARLRPNGEWFLKSADEMASVFRGRKDLLANTLRVAERCVFDFDSIRFRFPSFPVPEGETPFSYLHQLAYAGARDRYRPLSRDAARQIAHELDLIERLDLAGYFLVVWDIVRFCRETGILAQGRGSAANSAVCYALGITAVDPVGLDLLFERFLSEDRREAPDIDIDIAHQEREKVIQYVYERYGRAHAGMVCEVISYRGRSAVRDVGKALGFSLEQVDRIAKALDHHSAEKTAEDVAAEGRSPGGASSLGVDLESPRVKRLLEFCREIASFPRHLSIHVGGMVITADPLSRVVPIENAAMPGRTVIQWDKDDTAAAGLVKIDLLGLGMLTVIQEALKLVEKHEGTKIDLARLGASDPKVYDLFCAADTVGVFQIESRAQMNCLPRLKPRNFYDLVVEVALIRPGPIQGDMVHPYLRRRAGTEPVEYLHPKLEPILKRTLGVPLFQEQGMKVAVAVAGFSASQADELRRAMGHKRSHEAMEKISRELVEGMRRNGIPKDAAERIFKQLAAFADYGFPESHAASFALLVYASGYLKVYHHAAFTCATLNAQPMGFYSPATLVHDAKRHGVVVKPIDVAASDWDATLERGEDGAHSVRLGLKFVRGMGESCEEALRAALARRPFSSLEDCVAKAAGVPRLALESLATLGAFASFGLSRREATWRMQACASGRKSAGPLADVVPPEPAVTLKPATVVEETEADYWASGMSPRFQPISFFREELEKRGVLRASDLPRVPSGRRVRVAGLVICRQHPPTAKGFTFLTLEDETGFSNVVVRPKQFEEHRALVRTAAFLVVEGTVEKAEGVINIRGERFRDLGERHLAEGIRSHDFH